MRCLVAVGLCCAVTACTSRRDDGRMAAEVPTAVAVEAATSGCLHEEGQRSTYETTALACSDGGTLYWNEAGWGYDGGSWHPRGFDETEQVPGQERARCRRGE